MRAGLVYWNTGTGINRDASLLEDLLRGEGYAVRRVATRLRTDGHERRLKFLRQSFRFLRPFDVQFHLEQIHWEQFLFARRNFIIPNPEFTDPAVLPKIPRLTAIACKTRLAETLFRKVDPRVRFIGFTSEDRHANRVKKDFRHFLHVAGKSTFKGTDALLQLWQEHPEWPQLTIVWSPVDPYGRPRKRLAPDLSNVRVLHERLSEERLRALQNACGIHVCPSVAEGFGHYIMEGLSTGAVVLTTDGPPMNEFVRNGHGFLIPARESGRLFMSPTFAVTPEGFAATVERVLATPVDRLSEIGQGARRVFEANDGLFRDRFRALVRESQANG